VYEPFGADAPVVVDVPAAAGAPAGPFTGAGALSPTVAGVLKLKSRASAMAVRKVPITALIGISVSPRLQNEKRS
jgi:hypothetical protein